MLWIETYRPLDFVDMVGQDDVRRHLRSFAERGVLPHLLLTGPHGTGKSVSVECFARLLYGEGYRENLTVLNVPVLFAQGKQYLEEEPQFAHLFRRDESLLVNIKRIVKWYASMQPLSAPFKMVVFEGAEALTRDLQQALRRIMERYSATCRFVYMTRYASALIPAVTSRCLPLFFSPLDRDQILSHLTFILGQEDVSVGDDGLALIVEASRGDLRRAIMLLEVVATGEGEIDPADLEQSETGALADSCTGSICNCDHPGAVKAMESMVIDHGLTGREVARELRRALMREYPHPRLVAMLAETDHRLGHASSDLLQLNAFAAEAIREVSAGEGP